MANINHKRGDTFQLDFTLTDNSDAAVDLTNYTIRAMARDTSGTEQVEWTETNGGVNITSATDGEFNLKSEAIYTTAPSGQLQTRSWPLGVLNVDIEFTDDSSSPSPVSSSDTFTITVIEDITRDS